MNIMEKSNDWTLGMKRFKRLRAALGYEERHISAVTEAPYAAACREFGAAEGQLFEHLAGAEFGWMDGDHILALYKAWKVRHAE